MKFGIYILFFNRIDLNKTIFNINNIVNSQAFINRNVKLYLVDDCSTSPDFISVFKNLGDLYPDENIVFLTNKYNLNIIQNPINIFVSAKEDYISLLADDDLIELFHIDNFVNSILSENDDQVLCYVNDFNETIEGNVISTWKLKEFMSDSVFYRCLSFLITQSDMYLYGFYSTKVLRKYSFYGFKFFKKSPTSWAYTLPFYILLLGKIKNIDAPISWNYNSKSDKHYLEYNESSKILWYVKYILRELELHFIYTKYLPNKLFSYFIILFIPFVFVQKNLFRILKIKN